MVISFLYSLVWIILGQPTKHFFLEFLTNYLTYLP